MNGKIRQYISEATMTSTLREIRTLPEVGDDPDELNEYVIRNVNALQRTLREIRELPETTERS